MTVRCTTDRVQGWRGCRSFGFRRVAWALLVGVWPAVAPPRASGQEDTLAQLDWLVGSWTFEDRAKDGEYRETGTRDCAYALGGDYIVCESHGVNHRDRARTYLWYINYNREDRRFEIASLLQGYPRKLLYTATVHAGGRRIEITGGAWEGDSIVVGEGGATVTYDGSGEYVWETERYRDVARRRGG